MEGDHGFFPGPRRRRGALRGPCRDIGRRPWATPASHFAAARVRPPCQGGKAPRAEEWLLIEWPAGEPEPTKYRLSTLPPRISRRALVTIAKRRWRIGRDHQDLKQEPRPWTV